MEPSATGALDSVIGEMAFAASALAGTGGPISGSPGDSSSALALSAVCRSDVRASAESLRLSSLNDGLFGAGFESRVAQFARKLEADALVDLGERVECCAVLGETLQAADDTLDQHVGGRCAGGYPDARDVGDPCPCRAA